MKIGRNVYQFEVDGTEYRAAFNHKHMERVVDLPFGAKAPAGSVTVNEMVPDPTVKGHSYWAQRCYFPIRIGTIRAQHVTTCLFGTKDQISDGSATMSAYVGVATCSVRDDYNRILGMRTAFERCLQAMGVQFVYEKDAKGKRQIRFGTVTDRQVYGAFMNALFASMQPAQKEKNGEKAAA